MFSPLLPATGVLATIKRLRPSHNATLERQNILINGFLNGCSGKLQYFSAASFSDNAGGKSGSSSSSGSGASSGSGGNKKRPGPSSALIRRRGGAIPFDKSGQEGNQASSGISDFSDDLRDQSSGEPSDAEKISNFAKSITEISRIQVPKPIQTLILPTSGRPLFPGFTQAHLITDRAVFHELKKLRAKNQPYAGLFFRRNGELNTSSSGEVSAENPLGFNINDISNIGTFVQIMRIDAVVPQSQPDRKTPAKAFHSETKPTPGASGEDTDNEAQDLFLEAANEWTVILKGHRRVQLQEFVNESQPLYGKIEHLSELPLSSYDKETMRAYMNEIFVSLRDVVKNSPILRDHLQFFAQKFDGNDPYFLADFAATLTSAQPSELQEIIAQLDLEARLQAVLLLLKKELKLNELQEQISRQVESKVNESQRKYFLRQQLKQIQQELGVEQDDKSSLVKKFEKRIDSLMKIAEQNDIIFPEEPKQVIDEELEKLKSLDKDSSEFNQTRRYLEWLTAMPWTKFTKENYDLLHAAKILQRDHYGLEDIKERIMEYIAVGNLKGKIEGKILLLVGPPGVGKTSIGKSIASALGREFYRFSVGGLSDVSEIKGHRRTYVGAMPGKIIQCLKQVDTMNPLILIDEIDKLSSGYRGDPASALLELLDPSQNTSFMDHYLDTPVDVSKILFVCTANETDTIPGPLLDRMEVLRLSGYDLPEKVSIAKDYLVPRAKKDAGLVIESPKKETSELDEEKKTKSETVPAPESKVKVNVELSDSALEALARWYCREAGVRRLQQYIERIYRKVSLAVVTKNEPQVLLPQSNKKKKRIDVPGQGNYVIDEKDLEAYIGKPIFQSDRLYGADIPPGVVMGLAWSSYGGSSLYIETTNVKAAKKADGTPTGGAKVTITGKLGEVMKESSTLSLTNAKHIVKDIDPSNNFFDVNDVHLHVPEGATPKDGPSAGVTMTTALVSLALNRSVSPDLAMTGEISLTGMVLPVGGIKEKIIAARRSGVRTIILPEANRRDFDELPDYLREDIIIHFAKTYADIYRVAFP